MNFHLNNEQKNLQEEIKSFAKKNLNKHVIERDKNAHFDFGLWKKCAEMGLCSLNIPENYGGLALNAQNTTVCLEALGEACEDGGLAFAIAAHNLACVVPLVIHGNALHLKNIFEEIVNGDALLANAMTEPQSGSEVFNMLATAKPNDDNYILNGLKTFVTNANEAKYSLAYFSTNREKGFFGGLTAFLVPNDAYKLGQNFDKMGLRTCSLSEILFENSKVQNHYRIGKEGAGGMIFTESMYWERACLSALHIGKTKKIIDDLVLFVNERKSGDVNIGKHQSVSHKIAELYADYQTARLMVYQASTAIDEKKNALLYSSVAKLKSSELIQKCCKFAMQIYGGMAYVTDFHIERYFRDAQSATIYSGTSEIQKNIISKSLGIK